MLLLKRKKLIWWFGTTISCFAFLIFYGSRNLELWCIAVQKDSQNLDRFHSCSQTEDLIPAVCAAKHSRKKCLWLLHLNCPVRWLSHILFFYFYFSIILSFRYLIRTFFYHWWEMSKSNKIAVSVLIQIQ